MLSLQSFMILFACHALLSSCTLKKKKFRETSTVKSKLLHVMRGQHVITMHVIIVRSKSKPVFVLTLLTS